MAIYPGKFEQVVIILSTGRTGTMGLARLFDEGFDQITALHEPRPSRNLRLASNKAVAGKLSREQLLQKLTASRRRLLARIDTPMYVESNWYLYGFLDVLKDVFGPVKILHVVRDPRTLIRSYINFGTFKGIKYFASNFFPHWTLKTDNCPARSNGHRWADMSDIERLAWIWKTVNTEIQRGEDLFGEDYLRIRYEDLFHSDPATLKQVVEWMHLPWRDELPALMHQEKTNASRKEHLPKFDQWSPDQQERMLHHCSELMECYGYLPHPNRATHRPLAVSQ